MYTFINNDTVLKNGEVFFKSPFSLWGAIYTGLVVPTVKPEGLHNQIEAVVGGGSCCHGYVMSLTKHGKIRHIVEMEFNVYFIAPVVHTDGSIDFLASGTGCDGEGLRLLKFRRNIPEVVSIAAKEEAHKLLPWSGRMEEPYWFNVHPFDIPEIWDLLKDKGLDIDRERTEEAQKTFGAFYATERQPRGWHLEWLKKREAFKQSLRGG